jgi:hypothetical protein
MSLEFIQKIYFKSRIFAICSMAAVQAATMVGTQYRNVSHKPNIGISSRTLQGILFYFTVT